MENQRAVYVIGNIRIKDAEKWAEYRDKVPATLVAWGGELVFRGQRIAVLDGEFPYSDTVAIRFPDAAAAEGWFRSAEYQALISLRELGADVALISYQA